MRSGSFAFRSIPPVGLLAAIVLLWNQAIGPLELALMISLYVLTVQVYRRQRLAVAVVWSTVAVTS